MAPRAVKRTRRGHGTNSTVGEAASKTADPDGFTVTVIVFTSAVVDEIVTVAIPNPLVVANVGMIALLLPDATTSTV